MIDTVKPTADGKTLEGLVDGDAPCEIDEAPAVQTSSELAVIRSSKAKDLAIDQHHSFIEIANFSHYLVLRDDGSIDKREAHPKDKE